MRSPSSSVMSKQMSGKVGLKRGPWTAAEDRMLADFIGREGEGRWRTLPKKAGLLRCGKSCRLRWMNYLRPSVKRGHITADEEDLILRLHRLLGNRWSLIAGRIPGRTDNEIKNYWNTHLSKKLITQGIDPKTHKPLLFQHHHHHHNNIVINHNNYNNNNNNVVMITNNNIGDHDQTTAGAMTKTINVGGDHHHQRQEEGTAYTSVKDGHGHDDDMINCCPDDAFSSFLNSLINDEMFNNINNNNSNQQGGEYNDDDDDDDDQNSSCLI